MNCNWVSEFSASVLSMSHCFPGVASNPVLSQWLPLMLLGQEFLVVHEGQGKETRGSNRGERRVWKQLSATGLYLWCFASFQESRKGGICLNWQNPQPEGTELFSKEQL